MVCRFPDPSAVGLAVSYTLALSGLFTTLLNMSADLETQIICVARILEYTMIRPESAAIQFKSKQIPSGVKNWPTNGKIELHEARVSYIPGKDILRGISCTFSPKEKVRQ